MYLFFPNAFVLMHPKNPNTHPAHSWCDGHSINISVCGVWGMGDKSRGSNLLEGASHTYILRLG